MNLFGKKLKPIVIKISLILLLISTMFPPFICVMHLERGEWQWHSREWGFIFYAPNCMDIYGKTMEIDIRTLAVEYILIIILGCLIHMFMREKRSKVKKCLYCAEEIESDAVKCRFCGEPVSSATK